MGIAVKENKREADCKFKHYPETEFFRVIGTIGIPHSYCITARHVAYASNHCGGMLDKEAIKGAEEAGASCGICRKQGMVLTIDEHEQALLINCKTEDKKELRKYLVTIQPLAVKEGFAGFVFKKGW